MLLYKSVHNLLLKKILKITAKHKPKWQFRDVEFQSEHAILRGRGSRDGLTYPEGLDESKLKLALGRETALDFESDEPVTYQHLSQHITQNQWSFLSRVARLCPVCVGG